MAIAALIDRAAEAGLTLCVEVGELVVRGPRSQEPLAREVLARKAEVLEVLTWPSRANDPVRWGSVQTRRLIGNFHPPIVSQPPDPRIVARVLPICEHCCDCPCLPELSAMTGGRLCFTCWEISRDLRS